MNARTPSPAAQYATAELGETPKRSWWWGFAPPPAPLIVPQRWKVNHLIGDAYENDLRRHVRGYWMLAASLFAPMIAGAVAAAVDVFFPHWRQFGGLGSLLLVAAGAVTTVIGYAFLAIDTEPPERVSLRIPLDWNLP